VTSVKQPRRRKVAVYGDVRIKWAYVQEQVRSPLNIVVKSSNSVSKMAFRELRDTACKFYYNKLLLLLLLLLTQWSHRLRRWSKAARLLGLWVRIPPRLSLVRVVCCQVGISASGWSLVERSTTQCDVIVKPRQWGASNPLGAVDSR